VRQRKKSKKGVRQAKDVSGEHTRIFHAETELVSPS
jgi:hypothetical protein